MYINVAWNTLTKKCFNENVDFGFREKGLEKQFRYKCKRFLHIILYIFAIIVLTILLLWLLLLLYFASILTIASGTWSLPVGRSGLRLNLQFVRCPSCQQTKF